MQPPPQPPAAEVLHALARRHGVDDSQEYIRVVQKLSCERQYSLLQNCEAVATHLQALGIAAPLVGRMLQHCPALFSYPAPDRAAPLLEALMGAGVGLGPTQVHEEANHGAGYVGWAAGAPQACVLAECIAASLLGAHVCTLPLPAHQPGPKSAPCLQAAEVFVCCPALGNTRNVMPAIVRLVVEQHALSWQAAAAPEPAAECT
jgi:hypothetical protein